MSNVRTVPSITTLSGMMLLRIPPLNAPTVTIAGTDVMSDWRLMIVCSPITICEPMTMGSTPSHGRAPCVWRPCTVSVNEFDAAIVGPAR